MKRRSNQGFWERLRGPSSISYRDELARRRKQYRKDARLSLMREKEAEREALRREREQIREANKLKRQLLKEEQAERRAEAAQREAERATKAIPSRSAIERAYAAGAKTLTEAMEMARGNPATEGDLKRAFDLGFKAGEARGHHDESRYRFERDYYRRWASLDKHIRPELDKQWAAGYEEGVSIRFHNPHGSKRNRAALQTRGRNWIQESYETGDPDLKARAKELRKRGYRVTSSSMGPQVTQYGVVKMTLLDIRPGSSGDEYLEQVNPAGTKGRFERCVKAVSERGGAIDPRAVCGAQEQKYRKNPDAKDVRRELRELRAEMKREGIRKISPFNGGLTNAEVFYNQRRFALETQLKDAGRRNPSGLQMYSGLTKPEAERRARKLKAEDAKLRKMGGSGNYDSVEVHQTFEGPGHKEYGVFVTKRNPADAAIAVSEEFHGRKVKAMIPVQSKRHYHKYLAELGELRKLVVLAKNGKTRVVLTDFDGAMLCTNEDKNQLFIVGGDQAVDPADFGISSPHEVETLGEVTRIEYFTDKEHLGDEGGVAVYDHKFRSTNKNGRHVTVRTASNPELIYHLRDERLEFSGGSYEIRAEGIDL